MDTTGQLAGILEPYLLEAARRSGVELGSIQLLDGGGMELHLAVHIGFGRDLQAHFRKVNVADGTIHGQALRAGVPIIVPDVLHDPEHHAHRAIATWSGYRSMVAIPILDHAARPIGLLSLHGREPRMEWDLDVLDPIVNDLASIIRRLVRRT